MPEIFSFILLIIAYLIGSTSTAIITCKLMGKDDPRTVGSNNPGATNVLRSAGKKAAIVTLLGDLLKGLIPVAIGHSMGLSWGWLGLIGTAAFLGHLYPLYYGFKGGKGVATALGVYLGLNPILGVVILLTWLISALITNISSASALIATFLAPLFFYLVTGSGYLFLNLVIISGFIYWRHNSNISKILNGTEGKISGDKTN